jgi:ornithine cyclodeaminase/alanine dehydrogenase-like protein (mu-crystallin family)
MDVGTLIKEKRILYLSRNDLLAAGLLDYRAVVEDVRQGLCAHARGETINEKVAIDFDVDKDWKISALIGITGSYAGVKWLGANMDNHAIGLPRSNSIIALNDRVSGRVLCVMDGAMISALRTGAYAALVTEVLAQPGPATLGIMGAGVIARCVLLCMTATHKSHIRRVLIHDIVPENGEKFARLMAEKTGLSIEPVNDVGALMQRSNITVSATTAMTPFIKLADVRPASTHIHLGGWEDEKACVVACAQPPNKIVCDDIEKVLHRNVQTVAYAFHDGLIGREHFYGELGEILLGKKPGREGDEMVYFNAVGLPVLDVSAAGRLFEAALEKNLGALLGSQTPHWILTGQQ